MSLKKTSDDLKIYEGSTLRDCYKVESLLGQGGYGFVTRCHNIKTNETVAVKINKSHPKIMKQAKLEIDILKCLRCLDPDTCNIVRWNGFFFHKEHICLNFEVLDQSLYDYLKDQNFQGIPINVLRPILYQLATALKYLGSEGIIHADIKPENIMVLDRGQVPLKVKMIDFGLAHLACEPRPTKGLQTTFYRAPELILLRPYSGAIDMWSLGVTAVELATGFPMYPGNIDYDVLSYIINSQGQPADYILDNAMGSKFYFHYKEDSPEHWIFKEPHDFYCETGLKPIEARCFRLKCLDQLKAVIAKRTGHHRDICPLVRLIKKMLDLDADLRIKPMQALSHPFFKRSVPQRSKDNISSVKIDHEDYDPKDSEQKVRFYNDGVQVDTTEDSEQDVRFYNNGVQVDTTDNSEQDVRFYNDGVQVDTTEDSEQDVRFYNDGVQVDTTDDSEQEVHFYNDGVRMDTEKDRQQDVRFYNNSVQVDTTEDSEQDVRFYNEGVQVDTTDDSEQDVHFYKEGFQMDTTDDIEQDVRFYNDGVQVDITEDSEQDVRFYNDGVQVDTIDDSEQNVRCYKEGFQMDTTDDSEQNVRFYNDGVQMDIYKVRKRPVCFYNEGFQMDTEEDSQQDVQYETRNVVTDIEERTLQVSQQRPSSQMTEPWTTNSEKNNEDVHTERKIKKNCWKHLIRRIRSGLLFLCGKKK